MAERLCHCESQVFQNVLTDITIININDISIAHLFCQEGSIPYRETDPANTSVEHRGAREFVFPILKHSAEW